MLACLQTRELEAGGFENDAELAKKAQAFAQKSYSQKRYGEKGR